MRRPASPAQPVVRMLDQALRRQVGVSLEALASRRVLDIALERAAKESGQTVEELLRAVEQGREPAVQAFAEQVLVRETYLSRHPEQFEALAQLVFPRLPLGELRVWSAGCSTGEEVYRLAILLAEQGRLGEARILGTDMSERALAQAREGAYGRWSMRRLEARVRNWLSPGAGGRSKVDPRLRAAVSFRRQNLVLEAPPGQDFQLIVCRNVLIYFDALAHAKAIENLVSALAPGGWLLLGPSDAMRLERRDVEPVSHAGVTIWRKLDAGEQRADAADGAAPSPWRLKDLAATEVRPPKRVAARPAAKGSYAEATSVTQFVPPSPSAPVAPPDAKPARDAFELAREALVQGDVKKAERLSREAVATQMRPEAFLLLSAISEARGDIEGAVWAVKRALYLEPSLVMGHVALIALYGQLGDTEQAELARRNALDLMKNLGDDSVLWGVEAVTVSALRTALRR